MRVSIARHGAYPNPENTKLKKLIILLTTIVLAGMIVVTIAYLDLKRYATEPTTPSKSRRKTLILIQPGSGLAAIAHQLAQKNLVTAPLKFRLIAMLHDADTGVKAGEYALSADMTPMQIINIITQGRVHLHRITIPEGFNLSQIAAAVDRAGFAKTDLFIESAQDPSLIKRLKIEADSLEGYLFPDTYFFARGTSAVKIIETMVGYFHAQFKAPWKKRAAELGFSVHEIVTLASIIEKETGNPGERKLISSVFHNRLKRKMRLETDPTVIYGIKDYDGNITRKHLTTWTPYNTYMIRGLPPGPIASPGAASLQAALYPEDTKYLFFVSKKDSTHYFSTNIRDHNRAVRKYQLRSKH